MVEWIDVRVDVRAVELGDLFLELEADDHLAVDEGQALIVRVEVTLVPAEPTLQVYEAPPMDYVIPKPADWERIDGVIDDALSDLAEESADAYRRPVSQEDLRTAASITAHGDLPGQPQ